MVTLELIGAAVLIFLVLIGIVVWVSKSSGKSVAERDSLKEGHRTRNRFDEENSKPPASGRALIERLRDMGR